MSLLYVLDFWWIYDKLSICVVYFLSQGGDQMAKVKSIGDIVEKWGRVTPQRTDDYAKGIQNPKEDWATATKASEPIYKTAVVQAANEGRFGKGVSSAGTQKWRDKTLTKGTVRWGPGVQDAQGDYEKGFAPFRDTIERTSLPQRFPKGDPRNIERVKVVASALHKKKVGG